MTVVLDSWAVMRFLLDEGPAAGAVEELLARERPVMSWVNVGEVAYVTQRRHGRAAADETVRDLRGQIAFDQATPQRVMEAARIKADHAMAYADAFAAATTITHDAELWTGDPELLVADAPWRWRDLRG